MTSVTRSSATLGSMPLFFVRFILLRFAAAVEAEGVYSLVACEWGP